MDGGAPRVLLIMSGFWIQLMVLRVSSQVMVFSFLYHDAIFFNLDIVIFKLMKENEK